MKWVSDYVILPSFTVYSNSFAVQPSCIGFHQLSRFEAVLNFHQVFRPFFFIDVLLVCRYYYRFLFGFCSVFWIVLQKVLRPFLLSIFWFFFCFFFYCGRSTGDGGRGRHQELRRRFLGGRLHDRHQRSDALLHSAGAAVRGAAPAPRRPRPHLPARRRRRRRQGDDRHRFRLISDKKEEKKEDGEEKLHRTEFFFLGVRFFFT